jgi:hypothetical protein
VSGERLTSVVFTWRAAFSCGASPFSPTEKHVAHTLAMYMSERGDSCWPSIPSLSEDSGRADSTVRDALNSMTAWGFLGREKKRGRGNSNQYVALIPEWFDRGESAEENRRRAALFAEGKDWRAVAPVVMLVPESPSVDDLETAGERRFYEGDEQHVIRRSPVLKPPEGPNKTTGVRRGTCQDHASDHASGTEEPPDGVSSVSADTDERDRLVMNLKLALTTEIHRPVTRTEHGWWSRVADELADADPPATVDDVRARCAAYRSTWPEAALTPGALSKHWAFLGGKVELEQPEARADGWVEKTGWRLDDDDARQLLTDRRLPPGDVDRLLGRCAELRAENLAADEATRGLLEGRDVA